MSTSRSLRVVCIAASLAAGWLAVSASAQQSSEGLPALREPFGNTGQAIYPAFEGWGTSQDGTYHLIVLGYMNRNKTQTLEIPVGPNNRIEPGGPDYGQPTLFLPGRQTTVFAIKVPKDFGANKLTWTLVANGQPAVVTFHLHRDYVLNLYKDEANGNAPPLIKLAADGPMVSGPQAGFAQTLTGSVGQPVPLKLWAQDPPPLEPNWESIVASRTRNAPRPAAPPDQVAIVNDQVLGGAGGGRGGGRGDAGAKADLTAVWTKLRGPGTVTVTPPRVPLVTNSDGNKVVEASATATFSAPGEYVLRAEAIEAAGAGDGLCCFTFANVNVIVK